MSSKILILNLLILLILSFPKKAYGQNSPRLMIEGERASLIIWVFEMAGMPTQKTDFGDFISAKSLNCHFEYNLASCHALDYGNRSYEINSDDSNKLRDIFLTDNSTVLNVSTLDCIDWNVQSDPGEKQQLPTCLYRIP